MLCQLIALNSHYHREAEHIEELQAEFDHWKEKGGFLLWESTHLLITAQRNLYY